MHQKKAWETIKIIDKHVYDRKNTELKSWAYKLGEECNSSLSFINQGHTPFLAWKDTYFIDVKRKRNVLTRTASLRVQALKSFYFAKNPSSLDLIQQSVNWSLKYRERFVCIKGTLSHVSTIQRLKNAKEWYDSTINSWPL